MPSLVSESLENADPSLVIKWELWVKRSWNPQMLLIPIATHAHPLGHSEAQPPSKFFFLVHHRLVRYHTDKRGEENVEREQSQI